MVMVVVMVITMLLRFRLCRVASAVGPLLFLLVLLISFGVYRVAVGR
jgi:hypothetical protein